MYGIPEIESRKKYPSYVGKYNLLVNPFNIIFCTWDLHTF